MKDYKYVLDIMKEELNNKYISDEVRYAFKESIEALEILQTQKDNNAEFTFCKWSTNALIARRKEVIEFVKECPGGYRKEVDCVNEELLKRKIIIEEQKSL